MKYLFLQKNTKKLSHRRQLVSGFTLIEIMVSVAIFAIIITSGMGALVSMTRSYQVSQTNKKVHEGLNYALEAMTRELRLGLNYEPGVDIDDLTTPNPTDGTSNLSIKFSSSDDRGTVIYYLDDGVLYLVRDGAANAQDGTFVLTNSSQLVVDEIRFTVIGTDPRSTPNYQQPLVWIQIKAHATGNDQDTVVVQTLVSQRSIDL